MGGRAQTHTAVLLLLKLQPILTLAYAMDYSGKLSTTNVSERFGELVSKRSIDEACELKQM